MMTRKHFETVALAIRFEVIAAQDAQQHRPARQDYTEGFDVGTLQALESVANRLADRFEADNSRFDREKFLTACGF